MSDETILQSKVPMNQVGKSLSQYLSTRFRYQTQEIWESLIHEGKVTVNGKAVAPEQKIQKGDLVAYLVALKEPPVDKNIQILHEEPGFLVAAKPGQLPSHADGNFIKNTFIYLMNDHLRSKGWKGEAHLVHRLDRETSGLLVVSKDPAIHAKLVRQFEEGTVGKEYLAVVKGRVSGGQLEVKGSIGKDPNSQISIRHKVVPDGTPYSKPSLTQFEKMRDLKNAALLLCIPKTGRTNQIRVHLDSIGHPLVGDKLYGRTDEEFLEFVKYVKEGGDPSFGGKLETARHLLHASKLSFDHPLSGERVTYEAPMPPDMVEYVSKEAV